MGGEFSNQKESVSKDESVFDEKEISMLRSVFNQTQIGQTQESTDGEGCTDGIISMLYPLDKLLSSQDVSFDDWIIKVGLMLRSPPSKLMNTCYSHFLSLNEIEEKEKHANMAFVKLGLIYGLGGVDAGANVNHCATKVLNFITSHTQNESNSILQSSFLYEYMPHLARSISAHVQKTMGLIASEGNLPFRKPFYSSSNDSSICNANDLLPLAWYTDGLQGEMRLLFSTDINGYDFINIREALLGYNGKTLLLFRSELKLELNESNTDTDIYNDNVNTNANANGNDSITPYVFGFYSETFWKDSKDATTSTNGNTSFVFTLEPNLRILKHLSAQYFNTTSYDKKQHGLGLGLGTGSSNSSSHSNSNSSSSNSNMNRTNKTYVDKNDFCIFIPTNLENCMSFSKNFTMKCLEIYACSGNNSDTLNNDIYNQNEYKKVKKMNQERARTVDRAQFFNNEFDREMFLGKTFAHQKDISNRDMM
jgi:hypothetical protein